MDELAQSSLNILNRCDALSSVLTLRNVMVTTRHFMITRHFLYETGYYIGQRCGVLLGLNQGDLQQQNTETSRLHKRWVIHSHYETYTCLRDFSHGRHRPLPVVPSRHVMETGGPKLVKVK